MAYAEFRYLTTALYQTGSTPNPIIAELPFTDVNYTSQLNSYGTFQGSVLLSGLNTTNLNVYNGTIPGKTILWVMYSDPSTFTSIPVWSGVIQQREYDSASQRLSISAQEMVSLYQKRRISVDKTYVAQNPAAIAKDLFQYAEAKTHGKTGLDYATVPVTGYSTNRVFAGYEYKSVYQAVKDLAQNFFDFVIKPYNTGGVLTNKLILGADFSVSGQPHVGSAYSASSAFSNVLQFPGNIISYKFPEDASGAANKLYGLGYGANGEKLIATATDPTKIANTNISNVSGSGSVVTYTVTWSPSNNKFVAGQDVIVTGVNPSQYNGTFTVASVGASSFTVADTATGSYVSGGLAQSTWPLLEDTANYIDIADSTLLGDVTKGQVSAISYPPTTVEIVLAPYIDPLYPTINIGDEVRVDIKDDYFPSGLNVVLRVVGISVNPGENGPSRVTLTLTRQLQAGII